MNLNYQEISSDDSDEELEGMDITPSGWGDYPIDDLLIRTESRTIFDIVRRIKKNNYILDPEFQRDFIWDTDKQSKLIESVIMRIPLPVFYLAEDEQGRMIVVDGLQRLTTFFRFLTDELRLKLPEREELNKKKFTELPNKFKNRIEDCNLTVFIIDSKVPERARLDIFERVNGGVPLTRQQMRNCLYLGKGTKFLKELASEEGFKEATGNSLKSSTMRDREFVNRFCAFQILGVKKYHNDMDSFLADALKQMNVMNESELEILAREFQLGLENNFKLFGEHAFRKYKPGQTQRSVINAAYWDVMSTGFSKYEWSEIEPKAETIWKAFIDLIKNEEFSRAITSGTNNTDRVKTRFRLASELINQYLDD